MSKRYWESDTGSEEEDPDAETPVRSIKSKDEALVSPETPGSDGEDMEVSQVKTRLVTST